MFHEHRDAGRLSLCYSFLKCLQISSSCITGDLQSSQTIIFRLNVAWKVLFYFSYSNFSVFLFSYSLLHKSLDSVPRVTNTCLPPGLEWIRCLFNTYPIWDRLAQKALALYNTQMLSCNGHEDGGGTWVHKWVHVPRTEIHWVPPDQTSTFSRALSSQ